MATPPFADVNAQIDQLWIYPIKSCAGIVVPEAELTATGLRWDRHWMVVDAQSEFLTQRDHPRMAQSADQRPRALSGNERSARNVYRRLLLGAA